MSNCDLFRSVNCKLPQIMSRNKMIFCHKNYVIFKNSASLMIFTPSFCALSSLEPASSPARTKSVFLLTLPLTLPLSDSILAVASSRVRVGKVLVNTKVLAACGFKAVKAPSRKTPE